ncbi:MULTISPECIES: Qat anti-phage system TatD family nuclease QatD [Xanthomonas]|uniref:Qat anti-phage system TatD family nuclease QatD n=1 Tax=Xanthomonas TaxID=338 RepID=UPI00096DFF2A|nr:MULTISPECIES: Qat anti-phage system TatD family nuclease QatD [Xanthomonas]MCC5093899.1 TatD family hydrolase [Xanthomonas campestris pv. incanae]MEA9611970.1 Qat anti-phage system TatD family nuclease QatD [Xanthomonas campestris pv. incanae]MEA9620195.1 Qat anti-phage system TatD family nuclease QatD [Xanthomonas campestris pv. incanae]SOU05522.1 Mg-dependent DNase [Xanthomonas arboricola pv. fragariae]
MAAPLIDMHCHLDLYPEPAAQVSAIRSSGAYVLSVTTTPRAWEKTSALAAGHSRIKTALGLHPQLAAERRSELALFDALLPRARYVGEVGLDGRTEYRTSWEAQVAVFDHVLASCVRAGGRILTLHSRRAATAVLDALERHPGYGVAILHWFSGSQRELARAIEMGCWFSVGSGMLQGQKGRTLAAMMPPDRVLTETDGPFAAENGKPLQPAQCQASVQTLAELWEIEVELASRRILDSFRKLASL